MNYYIRLILLLLFVASGAQQSYGAQCYTLGNGDFDDTTNWSCGRIPLQPWDTLIISTGDTITVTNSHVDIEGVWFQVFGQLDFANATRIVFQYGDTNVIPSMITFYTGASCVNGNGSSGLSFGSGGSGCDVYRPGQGANPGVYPTVPGSYYDGCVWASYLSISGLWTHYTFLDEDIKLEWSLHETENIMGYQVFGDHNDEVIPLGELDARNNNTDEYYEFTTSYKDMRSVSLYALHTDYTSSLLMSINTASLIGPESSLDYGPNPIHEQFTISDRSSFSIAVYSSTGQLVYARANERYYAVKTSDWEQGFYYLRVSNQGRAQETIKLIKL